MAGHLYYRRILALMPPAVLGVSGPAVSAGASLALLLCLGPDAAGQPETWAFEQAGNQTEVLGGAGACPGEGNCFEPNGTPGCENQACCEAVCAIDPSCCDNGWDELCVFEAEVICGDPNCPGDGGCFEPNGSPGCDDPVCCNSVCLVDPFCCDMKWDFICADEAVTICGPENNDCVDALPIFNGETPFSTVGATTDGPAHAACDFFGNDQVESDIWYNYTAEITGGLTVSVCSNYDSKLAVYDGCGCPVSDANLLACNDDFPDAQVTVPVVAGNCYKIRVGGPFGAQGEGVITITKELPPCPGEGNCFEPNDTPGCNDQACCEAVCAVNPFCCKDEWFDFCAAAAQLICGDPNCPGDGSCYQDNGSPGCDDPICCKKVCLVDQFCCNVEWDLTCANEASSICGPENNDCVDALPIFNGETPFSNVGATTDGPAHAACDSFGDDQIGPDIWYNYTADFTGDLTVSLCGSAYDTRLAVYDGCGCPVSDANLLACNDLFCDLQSQVTVPVLAGNCYKVRVGGFAGAQGDGVITITKAVPCPWDCGGDNNGDVGITDFLALLAQWGQVDTSCDFDGGGVGITDFLKLLANWGVCP